MMMFTLPTILTLSILFTQLTHPLSVGFTLLLQTILISISTGSSTYSFWFSYILFMIFLGGMLVLFIYVASLASNEFFSFSMSYFFLSLMCLLVISGLLLVLDPLLTQKLTSIPPSSIFSHNSTTSIIGWIYSMTSMYFTIFIVLYLLLTLIVIVKVTNLFKGPLRMLN
nr:NADH dehydrogenase subunit 6 [Jonas distinctus]